MEDDGFRITHHAGDGDIETLPETYKVRRHEPDPIGGKEGVIVIGEGKTGKDFNRDKRSCIDFLSPIPSFPLRLLLVFLPAGRSS